jgi:hypothetical protein
MVFCFIVKLYIYFNFLLCSELRYCDVHAVGLTGQQKENEFLDNG